MKFKFLWLPSLIISIVLTIILNLQFNRSSSKFDLATSAASFSTSIGSVISSFDHVSQRVGSLKSQVKTALFPRCNPPCLR